jgi:hypothetical protein
MTREVRSGTRRAGRPRRGRRSAGRCPDDDVAAFGLLQSADLVEQVGAGDDHAGNTYGRVIGLIAASLGAISALLSIGGAYPWWSLAIFALCIYIIHGIYTLGQDERALAT